MKKEKIIFTLLLIAVVLTTILGEGSGSPWGWPWSL